MYSLPNFCRVCLKYDKNLIDLAHIENEPSETLMSKLEQCVSEVDWTAYKPLLCHPCIKRLNVAFGFKKQCVQSASVLKSYLELVKETQKKNETKNESQNSSTTETKPSTGAFMVLPNQKVVKIVVGPQQQNSFQNVFLNLIPTSGSINPPALAPVTVTTKDTKDTNQNVFVNLNNTIQKFVPIAPNKATTKVKSESKTNVNQLLTDTKTEELSVEIDPTIFGLGSETESSNEEEINDWDEVITQNQINSKNININGDNDVKDVKEKTVKKSNFYGNYVPILPKHAADFLNSGQHFLSSDVNFEDETTSTNNEKKFQCETCHKRFTNIKILKNHIKLFHMGKNPFKCDFCYTKYATKSEYDVCFNSHKITVESNDESLTLKDFANTSQPSISNQSGSEGECPPGPGEEGMIFPCEVCKRNFNSSTGLLRHKVRKHNQKNKKKYFIKGMKNAKCDICNREFSTQSYMQLHRKLHMRDDKGYKYKVFGKSKYTDSNTINIKNINEKTKIIKRVTIKTEDGSAETIDVTPDITLEREMDEDSDPEEITKLKRKTFRIKDMRPDIEITKVKKYNDDDDDEDEDSDDNPLQMDLDENTYKIELDEDDANSSEN